MYEVTGGRYYFTPEGYAVMELIVDGYPACLLSELRWELMEKYNAVHLIGYPEDKIPIFEADGNKLVGYAVDERLARIAKRWWAKVNPAPADRGPGITAGPMSEEDLA